jgi:uncharacterized protein YjbJ (UPF0337 family)
MGELTDKIKGNANEAIGKGKQAIADSNNDASLAAEGKNQETKGKAQQVEGEIKGKLGNDI